jgi:hypothetical protein
MFDFQNLIGILAVILSFLGSGIYIRSILQCKTKPHFYTHFVWAILTFIAFFAQVYDEGGAGSWATGATAITILATAILALKFGTKDITRGDKISLFAALIAIVPWVMTDNPLWSVILISLIDVIAYYPTIRKSWYKPFEENLTSYAIGGIKFGLSIVALDNFTIVTTLYPAVIVIANIFLISICLWRQRVMMSNP